MLSEIIFMLQNTFLREGGEQARGGNIKQMSRQACRQKTSHTGDTSTKQKAFDWPQDFRFLLSNQYLHHVSGKPRVNTECSSYDVL